MRLTSDEDESSAHAKLNVQLEGVFLEFGVEVVVPNNVYRDVSLQCICDENGQREHYLHTLRQSINSQRWKCELQRITSSCIALKFKIVYGTILCRGTYLSCLGKLMVMLPATSDPYLR